MKCRSEDVDVNELLDHPDRRFMKVTADCSASFAGCRARRPRRERWRESLNHHPFFIEW